MSIVEVDKIVKNFGKLSALKNFSLNIEEGEFFGLLGPNGAGKTTLISIMAGLMRADSGCVKVNGFDTLLNFKGARRSLGVVPQELVYDPFFSVRETLELQSGYFGIRDNRKWIEEILENLGLISQADANSRALSGGMKRRLLIAQALVHRPQVIVLDEPTAGVDVELRQNLWKFIQRLNREGHTIILTTHYLEEAQLLCNRIAMMRRGEIAVLDTTQALLDRFASKKLILHISSGTLPSIFEDRLCPVKKMPKKDHCFIKSSEVPVVSVNSLGVANNSKKRVFSIRVQDGKDIQNILEKCWVDGCKIENVEVLESDLEDVFVQIIKPF